MRVPKLIRVAAATAAAASLALAIPAAASAATGPTPQAAPAPQAAGAAPQSAGADCSVAGAITFNPGNTVYADGVLVCFRPWPTADRRTTVTLYRNGTAVAYGRHDCYGGTADYEDCYATTNTVTNPPGAQNWCVVTQAAYAFALTYAYSWHECVHG